MSTPTTLDETFVGDLIRPGDPRYDEARSLFNGMMDKRPALIARCVNAEDVRAALAYAREEDLVVAVRGGGHSSPGHSGCDDGIVIDTSPMKSVAIDVAARTGVFGAGLTWGELDAATQEHGLAVTGGRVSHTGVAGLTLGSGSGWLERKCGLTCDNLLSAQVVTADGAIVRASADENPDLFWGIRGGGGNFGVVTEFRFRLHPVGPIIYAGAIFHPRSAARELLRFYRDFMEDAPDEIGGGLALATVPPEEPFPQDAWGQPACVLLVLHTGDPGEGEAALRPLAEWGRPWVRMVQPMPYAAVQQLTDPGCPWGIRDYFKVDYLAELPDEAIDAAVEKAEEIGSPFTQLIFCPLGGALAKPDRRTMAMNLPDAKWLYFCLAMWWEPSSDDAEIAWARSLMETMRPWTSDRAPLNFVNTDEGLTRLRATFGEEKFGRLMALKARYDPENVFALNLNIPPSLPA
jgi:FAD/FMN-containing dehydrogenase